MRMLNPEVFAVRGDAVTAPEATVSLGIAHTFTPATEALARSEATRTFDTGAVILRRRAWIDPVIFEPQLPIITLPQPLRRNELTVPVAPTATPADSDVFESPDGSKRYVLPRYALAFDKVGPVEEPRIAIADRNGTPTLVVTLVETPSPAATADTAELSHLVSVTLKYQRRVEGGGYMVQQIAFAPVPPIDVVQTTVTAEAPLEEGQRQQVLAALSDLDSAATLVVGRAISVAVPAPSKLPDGATGYFPSTFLLDWTAPPKPIVLSPAQRDRLGGDGIVPPLVRHRIPFGSRNHSYWQDGARPANFSFLPDRFLLARAADGNRRPQLRVHAAAPAADGAPRIAFEFVARPVIDLARLEAARPRLEEAAGVPGPIQLQVVHDPQPVLRLALPQNGAPSFAMTERPDADIDLEAGLAHAETMTLEDFQLVYQALFGASLTLLRGEVRVATGADPEDVPLELRLDETIGDVLLASPGSGAAEGLSYRLKNVIESPVRIDELRARTKVGDRVVPLRPRTPIADQRLAPGEVLDLVLEAPEPIPPPRPEAIAFDPSWIVVEPDAAAVWNAVFDRSAAGQTTPQPVTVEAFPALFAGGPDRPDDRVLAFAVTIEHGETVRLTETEPLKSTTVRVPIEPLIIGAPRPPIRYLTQTVWASGGIGTSPWLEAPGSYLVPVKAPPA